MWDILVRMFLVFHRWELEIASCSHLTPIFCCQSFSEDQTFSYQDDEGTITVLGSPIKFDPPNLNFKERSVKVSLPPNSSDFRFCFRPIGVPGLLRVTIHNINSHSSIQMLSISGNTIHFHCSFFEDKVSWTTIRILPIWLSRRWFLREETQPSTWCSWAGSRAWWRTLCMFTPALAASGTMSRALAHLTRTESNLWSASSCLSTPATTPWLRFITRTRTPSRCWRCTAVVETSTSSFPRAAMRRTPVCGRSLPITPSRLWRRTSWPEQRTTTLPTSGEPSEGKVVSQQSKAIIYLH